MKREPGVSRDAIEAHEEVALVALIGMALVVAGLMTVTAQRGGRINHPEANGDAAPAEDHGGRGRH